MKVSSLLRQFAEARVRFWSVLIFSLFLFGCKQEKEEFNKNIPQKEARNNFLETIDSVKLISFPSKMYWDKTKNFNDRYIPEVKIIDNIILEREKLNELVKILKIDYKEECMEAACYEPRHMLQFYKDDKIIAFYEICLECGGYQNSKNLDFLPPFCIQKGEKLKEIFKKLGLKNYGEGSPILKELEK